MTDRIDVPWRNWVYRKLTDIAHWVLLGTRKQNTVNLEKLIGEMKDAERKEAKRCSEEIDLRNQCERYKGRLIIMRGWVLGMADKPYYAERMRGWFDDDGEAT